MMIMVSCNEPCPCGSGKRYRECCLLQPFSVTPPHGRLPGLVSMATAPRQKSPPLTPDTAVPPANAVPVLPVEASLKYTYPEPFGIAEVTYIFPAGRLFVLENGLPVRVEDLKPGMRVQSQEGKVITITAIALSYEPPDPPVDLGGGLVFSRVIGTVKHVANTVMKVTWPGYTATNTPEHRYYSVTRQAYIPAQDLRVGELLRNEAGRAVAVQGVEPIRRGLVEVHNLEVEHFHNYHVGNGSGGAVLVHNGTHCIETPKTWEMEEIAEGGLSVRSPNGVGMSGAGGRLGTPKVRAQNAALAKIMRHRLIDIESGGDLGFERLIKDPLTGARGGAYADIVGIRNGRRFYVQTVDTLADGITPTADELAAAANIRRLTGGHVILVPKGQMRF